MADATKHHLHVGGGTLITDLKSLSSVIKTRRITVAFMFAFVAFTVFLAFNPSSNFSSPLFINIFTSRTSTTTSSTDSYRSQVSSIFSYFSPNNNNNNNNNSSSPQQQQQQQQQQQEAHNFTSFLPTQNTTTTRSQNTTSQSPSNQNHTQTTNNSNKAPISHANETIIAPPVSTPPPIVKNQTQKTEKTKNSVKPEVLKPNQTTIAAAPKTPVPANQTVNSTSNSVSLVKESSKKVDKGKEMSNYTAPPLRKQSNGTKQGNGNDARVSAKQGIESLVNSLMNCDLFDGNWVMDDSYPLYKPGSCSVIDEQFNCINNGRPDKDYQKLKWKPKACTLPRLNGGVLLNLLRGKRLVFVGDSLNRNMWESLVCILKGSVKDQSKVYEAHGRHHFRGEASYSFVFKDYGCSVEFFVSPFLVREWEMADKNGTKKETLRLDLVGRSSDQYKGADIIIFNTGHWWTHDKTSKGKDYYQEGSHVYGELNVLEAFRKALTTWSRWVDANVNPMKSLVFFRGYSASHFSGGQWNSGGACDSETKPIKNETYLTPYPPKMRVLEKVLKGMKTKVTYLNITRLTDYRKDGHPSIYRKQSLPVEERKSPLRFQDCSHWCLPGVPDAWNELFYAELLIKHYKKQQEQKRP